MSAIPEFIVPHVGRPESPRPRTPPEWWVTRLVRWSRDDEADKDGALKAAVAAIRDWDHVVQSAVARRAAWLSGLGARHRRITGLRLASRLVVGLGLPSPLEVGCRFHRTYGVPYLPGSGLKGLARAAHLAEIENHPAGGDDARHKNAILFGERDSAGAIDFLDGLPTSAKLDIDILNPHYPRYYQGSAPVAHDSESPTPVKFLAVPRGVAFDFALVARPGCEGLLDEAARLLELGLMELGAGGKTSSGYGVFEKPSATELRSGSPPLTSTTSAEPPRPGDVVKAAILADRTKKGGPKARHAATGFVGAIQLGAPEPADWKPGTEVDLQVASVNAGQQLIDFRWPSRPPAPAASGQPRRPGSPRR